MSNFIHTPAAPVGRSADSSNFRLRRGMTMLDKEFKQERAQTARDLAAIPNDPFIKKRLLDLAARYEDNRPPTMAKPIDLGIRNHRVGPER